MSLPGPGRVTGTPPSHEFLEHTGEVHLRVRAASWGALLAEAGRALAGLTLRGASPAAPGRWEEVEVRSTDREALLVDWLNELVFRAESRREVATEFALLETSDQRVVARVRGVAVAEPPALVKAATLHGVRVQSTDGGLEADVVLDI